MPPKEQENTELLAVVSQMRDFVQEHQEDVNALKEALPKLTSDLEGHIASGKEFQDNVTTYMEREKEKEELEDKTAFDIVVKGEVRDIWGYANPLERKLYSPKTKWSKSEGWQKSGSYEVDDQVMLMNDALYLMGSVKTFEKGLDPSKNPEHIQKEITKLETYKLFQYELEADSDLRKALNVATSNEGADWVPTGMSASLIDDVRLARKVSGMFPRLTFPPGVGSFENPIRGAAQRAKLLGESVSDSPTKYPAGTPPTKKVTFTAIKHGLRMLVSDEMNEDAAVAVMPLVREELIQAIVDGEEDSTINGDTSSTHQDSDVTAANDVNKSFSGLRYHAGGSSGAAAVDISTLNTSNLRSIEKAMGRFGVNPSDSFWLASISSYIQMLGISEVLTVDKLGPSASIVNGQLGQYDGRPIIVSEFMRQDLNTSGVYDGSTVTDTILLLVNRSAFRYADKPGGIKIETGRDIEVGQDIAVASRRFDFKQVVTPGTSEETVGLGYSLTA